MEYSVLSCGGRGQTVDGKRQAANLKVQRGFGGSFKICSIFINL